MIENEEALLNRITVDPEIMVGKPTIRGMRITVEQTLRALTAGVSAEDLLEDYPELEPEDIKASLLYAQEVTHVDPFRTDSIRSVDAFEPNRPIGHRRRHVR